MKFLVIIHHSKFVETVTHPNFPEHRKMHIVIQKAFEIQGLCVHIHIYIHILTKS